MGKEFSIVPREVARVETKYRRIATPLPHPDSLATLERLRRFEPQSMRGRPPLVWDRAEDIFVFDKYGNRRILETFKNLRSSSQFDSLAVL